MITLQTLNSLSHDELQELVRQRCSECGTVSNVVVLKDDKWHGFALAGVEMSTPAETVAVLQRLGDYKLGTMVVIKIEQA
jgi:hypothetical protein